MEYGASKTGDLRDIRDTAGSISPARDLANSGQHTFNPLVQGSIPWRPTSLIPAKSASDQAIRAAQGRIDQRLPMQLDAAWSGFLRVDVANTCVRFR
jgi:hypothetical protein